MKNSMLIATVLAVLASAAQLAAAADGQAIYEQSCKGCHGKGLIGSPKVGDRDKWAPLIKNGPAALEASVIKGKGKMMPNGGNPALTADDITAAVAYMISQAQ